jgi:hypothetical protein
MRIPSKHRLDAMTSYLGEIGIVDASSAEMGDVAVAALVGADV